MGMLRGIISTEGVLHQASITYNPESKPDCPASARLVHGSEKLLCVAEWFPCVNRNVTISPTFAVMFDGSNASSPSAPTTTICSA